MTDAPYLQQIFIVSRSHFLQVGSVGIEASDGVSAKSGDEAKPVKESDPRDSGQISQSKLTGDQVRAEDEHLQMPRCGANG
jgi:hypothetical protein